MSEVVLYEGHFYTGNKTILNDGDYTEASLNLINKDIVDNTTSIKIPYGTIVMLGTGDNWLNSNTHTFMGPKDISDLSDYGLDDKISMLRIRSFKRSNWGRNVRNNTVGISDNGLLPRFYSDIFFQGEMKELFPATYNINKITKMGEGKITKINIKNFEFRSIDVPDGYLVIIKNGDSNIYDKKLNRGIFILGPSHVYDLRSLNISSDITYINVIPVVINVSVHNKSKVNNITGANASHFDNNNNNNNNLPCFRNKSCYTDPAVLELQKQIGKSVSDDLPLYAGDGITPGISDSKRDAPFEMCENTAFPYVDGNDCITSNKKLINLMFPPEEQKKYKDQNDYRENFVNDGVDNIMINRKYNNDDYGGNYMEYVKDVGADLSSNKFVGKYPLGATYGINTINDGIKQFNDLPYEP